MEKLNTQNIVSTKVSTLMERIASTCDALISALEVNTQAIGSYGGGIMQQFKSDFVDRVVKTLLKIKRHIIRLEKELKNWLISSREELGHIVNGLLDTIDYLDTLLLEDGFMRNNFGWAIDELKVMMSQILEEIELV